ncbi:hypothetical protein [Geoglobus sp.]
MSHGPLVRGSKCSVNDPGATPTWDSPERSAILRRLELAMRDGVRFGGHQNPLYRWLFQNTDDLKGI